MSRAQTRVCQVPAAGADRLPYSAATSRYSEVQAVHFRQEPNGSSTQLWIVTSHPTMARKAWLLAQNRLEKMRFGEQRKLLLKSMQ